MKKLLLAASLLTVTLAPAPVVHAEDSISLRICEYISVNDKKRLRSFLKKKKLKIRTIFDSVQCNGQNLLVFAASSNALDAGEMIIGKLKKDSVAANLEAITKHSAHLAAIAKKRIG